MFFYLYALLLLFVVLFVTVVGNLRPYVVGLCLVFFSLLLFLTNHYVFFVCYELLVVPLLYLTYLGLNQSQVYFRSVLVFFYVSYFLTFGFLVLLLLSFYRLSLLASPVFVCLLFLTFVFKAPLYPFTGWLTWLHCYANTQVSIVLASFYLKLSALVFVLWFSTLFSHFLLYLACLTLVYTTIAFLSELLVKRLIALGSIFHCSFGLLVLLFYPIWPSSLVGLLFWLLHLVHAVCACWLFQGTGNLLYIAINKVSLPYSQSFYQFWFLVCLLYFAFPLFVSFFVEVILFLHVVCLSLSFPLFVVLAVITANFLFLFRFLAIGLYFSPVTNAHLSVQTPVFYSSMVGLLALFWFF